MCAAVRKDSPGLPTVSRRLEQTGSRVYAATTQRSEGAATQYFSNYRDYIIATSVHAFDRGPFEASFAIISRKIAGGDEEVVHTERLESTFAYSGDARAAASRAAQAYVDSRALV